MEDLDKIIDLIWKGVWKDGKVNAPEAKQALTEWKEREVAAELEKLKEEASVNELLSEDGFWYVENRLAQLKSSKEKAE